MTDESSADIHIPLHTNDQVDKIIKHSLGPLKPRDYDDDVLHKRLEAFDQRVVETGTATLADIPEGKAGVLKIPEVRGKKDAERLFGALTLAVDKMEAVLYKTDYMMKYKQYVLIRYARGPQQLELRGNLVVEDGLHHTDARRLYNMGMAIASIKTSENGK